MPVLFLQGISHAEGVQLSTVVEWGLSSPLRTGGVCLCVCVCVCVAGVVEKINCVCDLNESLNSGKGEVGVAVEKVNLTLMRLLIGFKFQWSNSKPA